MPYKDPEKNRTAGRERTKRWVSANPAAAYAARQRHYAKHKEALKSKAKAYYHANKERSLAQKRGYQLMKFYGLTREQYAALGSTCNICGIDRDSRVDKRTGKEYRLAVDHVRGTKKVRGLLCSHCNCGIGYFKHDVALLREAIAYLERTA